MASTNPLAGSPWQAGAAGEVRLPRPYRGDQPGYAGQRPARRAVRLNPAEQFVPRQGIPTRTTRPPLALPEAAFRAFRFLLKVPGVRTLLRNAGRKEAGKGGITPRIPMAALPAPQEFQPWETCMTMNRSWAYNPADAAWKSGCNRPGAE